MSKEDSKIAKARYLSKERLKKHDKAISKLYKRDTPELSLSEESSDLDERD